MSDQNGAEPTGGREVAAGKVSDAEASAGQEPQATDSQGTAPVTSASSGLLADLTSDRWRELILLPFLALVSALVLSAFVIVASDVDNLSRLGDEPLAALGDMFGDVGQAYWALLDGSFGSVRSISETLTNATPFIIVGLGLGLGFRAGLFNIGGQGQMIAGGTMATWIGFTVDAPGPILIPLAVVGAAVAGAAWGAIPGWLKARNGAHEVITTIMLNNIALLLFSWLLTQEFLQADGRDDPISEPVADSARLPRFLEWIFDEALRLHIGFLIALGLAGGAWWLLFRSTLGFEFRTVGTNPNAARYGGMNVTFLTVAVMALSGAFAGIGGANEVLGVQGRASPGFVGGIGFDAISVALLGRNHPLGIVLSGILFGALRAGAQEMQAATDVPIDMIQVVQALIIIFIAAPALIRAVFRVRLTSDVETQGVAS